MEILLWNNDWFPACCLFVFFFFLFPTIIFNRQHLILNKQCREPRRAQRQFPARTFWMCPVWCVCSLLAYAEFSLHSESFCLSPSLSLFLMHPWEWIGHSLFCSSFTENGLWIPIVVDMRYKMLEKIWETLMSESNYWRSTRGLMGLRALLVKWCMTGLLSL